MPEQGVGRSLTWTSAVVFRPCSLLLLFPPVFSSASGSELMRFSANIRCLIPDIASHVGGEGASAELFLPGLYKQPEHLAAVRARTIASRKPSANLYVRVNTEGRENRLCLWVELIKPSDSQEPIQSAFFPTIYLFWYMSTGHCVVSHSHGENKYLKFSFPWEQALSEWPVKRATCKKHRLPGYCEKSLDYGADNSLFCKSKTLQPEILEMVKLFCWAGDGMPSLAPSKISAVAS